MKKHEDGKFEFEAKTQFHYISIAITFKWFKQGERIVEHIDLFSISFQRTCALIENVLKAKNNYLERVNYDWKVYT